MNAVLTVAETVAVGLMRGGQSSLDEIESLKKVLGSLESRNMERGKEYNKLYEIYQGMVKKLDALALESADKDRIIEEHKKYNQRLHSQLERERAEHQEKLKSVGEQLAKQARKAFLETEEESAPQTNAEIVKAVKLVYVNNQHHHRYLIVKTYTGHYAFVWGSVAVPVGRQLDPRGREGVDGYSIHGTLTNALREWVGRAEQLMTNPATREAGRGMMNALDGEYKKWKEGEK